MAMGSAWATTISIVDGSSNPIGTLGTVSDLTWTSLEAAGMAGLTVSGPSAYDQATAYSARALTIKPSAVSTVTTITITAPDGYNIESYSLNTRLWSGSCPYNVIVDGTTYNPSTGADTEITSSDVNASTATFTIEATGSSLNWLVIKSWTVEVAKEGAASVDVTYHVYNDAKTKVATSEATTQYVGDAPAVPDAKGYCTYTYYSDEACTTELTALTSTTTDVYAIYSYDSPFAFEEAASYSAISKWYYLRIRPQSGYNNYIEYVSDSIPNVDMTTDGYTAGEEIQQWAFVGSTDPYTGTGLTIYNKTAGGSLILASNTPEGDGNSGGDTYATMETTGTKTYEVWYAEVSSLADGGFFLKTADSHYLNRRSTDNLAFWTGGHDIGSTFTVEEVPDDYSSQVISDIQPWYDAAESGYFNLTATAKSALETAGYEAALGSCDLATYNALKAIVDETSNYSYPETGYFRIKSSGQRIGESYIAYGQPSNWSAGLITVTADVAPADMSTVIRMEKGDDGYTLSTQGLNVQAQTSSNTAFPCSTDAGTTFNFDILSPGVVGIYSTGSYVNGYYAGYLHEAGWTVPGVVNWNANGSTASMWTVEDAETATVALTAATDNTGAINTYATLCVPFDVTLDGATAYTVTVDGDYAVLTAVDGTVAAGTPVVVVGDESATSATLNIGSGYAAAPATGILQGIYLAQEVDCTAATGTNYALAKSDGCIGFYHVASGFTLGSNRCYLSTGTAVSEGVKGFAITFGDTTDGIEAVSGAEGSDQIYDLSGRRVTKPTHGLYIKNGKKVVLK